MSEEFEDFPEGVAVIGMGLRFPGAATKEEYWRNLRQGKDCITHLSDAELASAGVPPEESSQSNYVKARGVFDDADCFDAELFGFTHREAETLDPQHRKFLEVAWEALESAGYDPHRYEGAIGVFAGANLTSYLIHNLLPHRELVRTVGPLQVRIRNDKDFLSTLVAYKLNLKGPAINVQNACSTSLVATSLACQSLMSYQCDMALAGGVSVTCPPRSGYLFQEGVYDPEGRCRAFDAEARGTVLGDGAGVVLLKRMEDALEDGDPIHGVIRGFALNNDGSLKLDYTAPSVDGQAEVIATALGLAGLEPEDITYVEAHGTGTPLGDPIEIAALKQAFGASGPGSSSGRPWCAVGSVKPNIGHLDAAAGVAGLIKALLALEHRELPPALHFSKPNPRLELDGSPFFINDRLRPWEGAEVRRAGISSFGVGGTNAHVVVEEAPAPAASPEARREGQLLTLSALDEEALEALRGRLADHLEAFPDQSLADVAYTYQVGRRPLPQRWGTVVKSPQEALEALRGERPQKVFGGLAPQGRPRGAAFLFSGIGDQYLGMAKGLYEKEEGFRTSIDRSASLLQPILGRDIRDFLLAEEDGAGASGEAVNLRAMLKRNKEGEEPSSNPLAAELAKTKNLHPTLFALEVALAELWMSWGIRPDALLGYSIGEYSAAWVAGVFSLEDGLRLVAERARIVQDLPAGAMVALPLAEDVARAQVKRSPQGEELSVAAVNGPSFTVVSGATAVVLAFEGWLEGEGVEGRRLLAEHAFHSTMMEEALPRFRRILAGIPLRPPAIPLISNVTGSWMTPEQATDPEYWAGHLCKTVCFGAGVAELWRNPDRVLIEIGPGQSLGSIALQSLGEEDDATGIVVPSLRHSYQTTGDQDFLLASLGRLWVSGVEVDWFALSAGEGRRRLPLPTYPFRKDRYWVEAKAPAKASGEGRAAASGEELSLEKRPDLGEWFYEPTWQRLPAQPSATAEHLEGVWLVLADEARARPDEDAGTLAAELASRGADVVRVSPGESFVADDGGSFRLRWESPEDWEALLRALQGRDRVPSKVVHGGGLTGPAEGDGLLDRGFFSLLALVQAWGNVLGKKAVEITVLTAGAFEVVGNEELRPEIAAVAGACRTIPQEYPNLSVRHIDLPWTGEGVAAVLPPSPALLEELLQGASEENRCIALRGRYRWRDDVAAVHLEGKRQQDAETTGLRRGGVYLITGGLGGIGFSLAEHLAREWQARLVLVGRTELPEEEQWPALLEDAATPPPLRTKLERLQRLREAGAELLIVTADVADPEALGAVRQRALDAFGAVHGILHAAGTAPGGLIQLKSRRQAEAVFAPKIEGSRALLAVFGADALDFVALFSSLTALTGSLGLVDHSAANAFLDAFARRAAQSGGPRVVAVNWDTWSEVGQAAEAGVGQRLGALMAEARAPQESPTAGHPLLGERRDGSGGVVHFEASLRADHWLFAGHQVLGQGILPGTSYVEMARGAAQVLGGNGVISLRRVVFSEPCIAPEAGPLTLRTTLRPAAGAGAEGWEFQIESSLDGSIWAAHARGEVAPGADGEPAPWQEPEEALVRQANLEAAVEETPYVRFGPRWRRSLQDLEIGQGQGRARLVLDGEFAGDLEHLGLHPALLDAATGSVRFLADGAFLPLGYERLVVWADLPAEFETRFRVEPGSDGSTLTGTVLLSDMAGASLASIEGYTLRRVTPEEAPREARESSESLAAATGKPPSAASAAEIRRYRSGGGGEAPEVLGILPAEGAAAFERIFTSGWQGSQILVSVRDFHAVRRQVEKLTGAGVDDHLKLLQGAGSSTQRRRSTVPYEAPRNELEGELVGLFQEMLGGERVGIHDNFFDLGGNSLVATQLISRLRETFEIEVPLRSLFEAPTVAELSVVVVGKQAEQVDEADLAEVLAELQSLRAGEMGETR